ncbi:senecionine N-oxygenase-like [Homalodisca vitripennis]|uniref:senecionine N-oxygenase-like n=1 Tax=Homalodisca vitripennis TaxID=197043 RepID=UPI001EE9E7D4|nr:senecionine N-oxygenase-like [Homalodisca vitripennis]
MSAEWGYKRRVTQRSSSVDTTTKRRLDVIKMAVRVAVVGAGPAGLCAARHTQAAGMCCTVFELSGDVGGTWQYTDCVGTDAYGIPIHTSMYRDLRINVPKDVVMFPGIPHKNTEDSYLTSEEILEYLHNYADMFNLRALCKFNHYVKRISRKEGEWLVTVIDLPNNEEGTYKFDALFICNGLNNKPMMAYIKGAESFVGSSMHSHDYRKPEPFAGQRVLIVGGGASALDLTNHISKFADKVFLSHRSDRFKVENLSLANNVVYKPEAQELFTHSVVFQDGTIEDIDAIVYCTGYKCNYSFMDGSCGITEDDGLVYPLYKHFVNANQNSMCILGNMCHSMQFPTFDIQVRFFLKSLTTGFLPKKEDMLQDIKKHAEKKLVDGKPKKLYFITTAEEDADYYGNLAALANIDPLPRVLTKIHARAVSQIYDNFPLFRGDKYKVIDNETFVVSPPA